MGGRGDGDRTDSEEPVLLPLCGLWGLILWSGLTAKCLFLLSHPATTEMTASKEYIEDLFQRCYSRGKG